MIFRAYLAVTRLHNVLHRDFVGDALRDAQLPDIASWKQLRSYLWHRHGCREAIRSAFCVWTNYQRYLLRQRKS